MPISKIPVGAIQSGTIATAQIADNAVTTAKILDDNVTSAKIPNDAVGSTEIASSAITRDELQSAAVNNISSDSIILNSTNGTADAGDFLVLDGTDGSGSNANHRILFDETFNPSTFNVSGTATAGQAIKVATGGGFEFGSAGGFTLLSTQTASSSASINFDSSVITTDHESYYVIINNLRPVTDQASLSFKFSTDNGSSFLSESYGARSSGGKTQTGADSSGSSNNSGYYNHGFYMNNAAGKGSCYEFRFNNLTVSGGGHKSFFGHYVTDYSDDTNYYGGDINGMVFNNTSVINYISFYCSSGNVLAGTFKLYGLTK